MGRKFKCPNERTPSKTSRVANDKFLDDLKRMTVSLSSGPLTTLSL
jgi:hypothetical protein